MILKLLELSGAEFLDFQINPQLAKLSNAIVLRRMDAIYRCQQLGHVINVTTTCLTVLSINT